MTRVTVIDSHTEGEPTRVVITGGPSLGSGSMQERLDRLRADHDGFRSAVVNEPRGSDVLVGALLCEPRNYSAAAGVIFFNNVGYLGMCGHGTIGLIATLAHLGRIEPGVHSIETPVGVVNAEWHGEGRVSVANVASYRKAKGVEVDVPGVGKVRGDVAWGGNWFFLVDDVGIPLTAKHATDLTAVTQRIREAINRAGFPEVDHIEVNGDALSGGDARNFVLCPGGAYDRSPCGTGTSAKLACLAADGALEAGATWTQESILGTSFRGTYQWLDRVKGTIAPTITGQAFITAEATLLLSPSDPLRWGIR
jgi:4-hydroxyproline epimerase